MDAIVEYLPLIRQGFVTTVLVTVLGALLALVVAFTLGLARLSEHRWVRWPAACIVEFFRGTSLVVQLFWLFFALPFFGIQLTALFAGILALGLNEGAYASEVVRGSIAARPKGQTEAAIALNMTPAQRMRRILLPQSIPAMLPPMGNVMVDLLKNSSLVSMVTVADLTFNAGLIRSSTGETALIYAIILVLYFVLSLVISGIVAVLERTFSPTATRRSLLTALTGRMQGVS
ncbi:ectoine/hydroxyectoine ABC transporter permease subunit EhuC [Dietzia sp. NCCP-2495]|uniref:ectoine/hydroxyectoine ABC transporter permease subunit EhuC n=1 Tax=Dietzia sp. NCCP-2495 TaxID=2934675 RepID=UPI002232141D|nr:ectoine/hydroxyectoine ABC transporter permease subunit EhuC [Dietzia sp. NCCP-2495]GLB63687.1 ectoine/hydroxyectoine ABC transporter permease subunit EhuC [Dietzia sp. NCCP-2495]